MSSRDPFEEPACCGPLEVCGLDQSPHIIQFMETAVWIENRLIPTNVKRYSYWRCQRPSPPPLHHRLWRYHLPPRPRLRNVAGLLFVARWHAINRSW